MNGNDELRVDVADGLSLDERATRASLWEAGADERERLADERELLADEREALADSRERTANRHEFELDRREAEQAHVAVGAGDAADDPAAAQAAVRRAEDGLRRAQAILRQARQASDRAEAAIGRRAAAQTRSRAAEEGAGGDGEERAWRADRRDFVAVDRDRIAGIRDAEADERDEAAAVREHIADERELEALERERQVDWLDASARAGALQAHSATTDHDARRDQRIHAERQRDYAAISRRSAATERARAAASWGPQIYGPMLLASFAGVAKQLITSDDLGEALMGMFRAGGFSVDLTHHAMHALGSRMWGFTQEVFPTPPSPADPDARAAMLGELVAQYPYIIEIARAGSHNEGSAVGRGCDDQFEFEFALDVLISGFERLHQQGWSSTDHKSAAHARPDGAVR